MTKPRLNLVAGPPGSGKTTLAKKLAVELHYPLLSRDALKAGYVHTQGMTDPDTANRAVYEAFFATIELLLARQISLIAEAAFQHRVWAPRLEALQAVAQVRIVVCQVDPALAHQRRLQRASADPSWSCFHADTDTRLANNPTFQPPKLSVPTMMVSTNNGYQPDLAEIMHFFLGEPA